MSLVVSFWRALEAANRAFVWKSRAQGFAARLQIAVNSLEGREDIDAAELTALVKEIGVFLQGFQKSKFAWPRLFSPQDAAAFAVFSARLDSIEIDLGISPEGDEAKRREADEQDSIRVDLASGRALFAAAKSSMREEDRVVVLQNLSQLEGALGASADATSDISRCIAEISAVSMAEKQPTVAAEPVPSVAAGESDEVMALRAFAASTVLAHSSWQSERPLRDWYGVFVNIEGQVSGLSLWASGLSGILPRELGVLRHLTSLWLPSNKLSGPIPEEIGELLQLTALDLSDNKLTGALPVGLMKLPRLTYLDLSSNQLSGPIPPEISALQLLTKLDLRSNKLSGVIPSEVGRLSSLVELDLSGNAFSGAVPIELGNLQQIAHIKVQGEQLFSVGQPSAKNKLVIRRRSR